MTSIEVPLNYFLPNVTKKGTVASRVLGIVYVPSQFRGQNLKDHPKERGDP